MTRLLLPTSVLCLVAAIAVTIAGRSRDAAAQVPPLPPVPTPGLPAPQQFVLKVGDSMRIDGAQLGCQVTIRRGRPTIECRRGGSVAGTYGTFMDRRRVTVARFRSPTSAQTILTARHRGGWRACKSATTARASAGCR